MNTSDLFEMGESSLAVNVPKAQEIKKRLVCPVHNRKVLFGYDYDNSGTHAYITRYCCPEHAKVVADAFKEAQLFDFVTIKDQ